MNAPTSRSLLAAPLALAALAAAPHAAAYEAGHVFVANRGGNNVVELRSDLTFVRTWFDGAGLSVPNGMAFDPTDNLWVADTGNNRIVQYDTAGGFAREFSTAGELGVAVESINFDAAGRLWATANPGLGRVVRYRVDGTTPFRLVDDPAFSNLANVNFTPAGNVLVSDFSGGRGVRELDATTGAVVREFGAGTSRHEDMIVDGDGTVFVSGYDRNAVMRFDASGTMVAEFTAPSLTRPTGVVLTSDCRLVVASFGSDELFEFRHDGTFLRRVTAPGLSRPESLAIAALSVAGSFELRDPVPVCRLASDGGVADAGGERDAAAGDAASRDAAGAEDAAAGGDGGRGGDAGADGGGERDAGGTGSAAPGCRCAVPGGRGAGAPARAAAGIGALAGAAIVARRGRRRRARG